MKTRILTFASFVVAFAGLTAPAFGQLGQTVMASIPFPFLVQGKQLAAGNYSFQQDESNPSVLAIRNQDGAGQQLVLTESAQMMNTPNQSELVFDKIDGRYFLSQMWISGNNLGFQIPEQKAETRLKKEYAADRSNIQHPIQQTAVLCTK